MEQRLATQEPQQEDPEEKPRQWFCLVTDSQFEEPPKWGPQRDQALINGKMDLPPLEKANVWKIKIIEDLSQAPEGWFEPRFDDSGWLSTELPTSWRIYHTSLLRTTFHVDDKSRFDGLRLFSFVLRQQQVKIYLNGELIGKINGAGKSGDIEAKFKDSAVQYLKNGENTLAITTRHNWRWGRMFMRVYNDGFDFNLDARLKEK